MQPCADDSRLLAAVLVAVAEALEKSLGASAAAMMKQAGGLAAARLLPAPAQARAGADPLPGLVAELNQLGLFGTVQAAAPTDTGVALDLPADRLAQLCTAAGSGQGALPAALSHLGTGAIEYCARRGTGRRCRAEIGPVDAASPNRHAQVRFYE